MLKKTCQLEYIGQVLKRVVLFYYEWYDPRHLGGTHKNNHLRIIEINHTKKYGNFDQFFIAQSTRQVYYTLSKKMKIKLENSTQD